MNKVILIIILLLNIVTVEVLQFNSYVLAFPITLLLSIYLFYKRIFNFKYITFVTIITVVSFIIFNLSATTFNSITSSITLFLSTFIIASLIQNIGSENTINIYKYMTIILLLLMVLSTFLNIEAISFNLYFILVLIITLIVLTFKKEILFSLLYSFILLLIVIMNYLGNIQLEIKYLTVTNIILVFGNGLGIFYLINNKSQLLKDDFN